MIQFVPFGPPAREALTRAIRDAKTSDPLAPVTVVVPNNYAGLALRRDLAATAPMVNVRWMVLARLAELLGGAALAASGRSPLVPWLESEAVRTALRETPGVFAPVAAHPSTARRLAAAVRELREIAPESLERVERLGPRPTAVVAIARRARELTNDYFDVADLLDAAATSLGASTPAANEAGLVVFYLPREVTPAGARLFRTAAALGRAAAIIGITGDPDADEQAAALAAQLGEPVTPIPSLQPRLADSVASLPDAEEEVRDAVRAACRLAAEQGIPLHRIAILYGQAENYGQLVHEVLDVAGIPHNGPPIRTLAQSVTGRALLGLYRAVASGFRRDAVVDWLTSAPIARKNQPTPSHRWDQISRDAGVVRGVDQWRQRLESWAAREEAKAAEFDAPPESRYYRGAASARELAAFISELQALTASGDRKNAAGHAGEALRWLGELLPEWSVTFRDDPHATEQELSARNDVVALLESIVAIQAKLPPDFGGRFERAEFAVILEEALRRPAGSAGKLGEGIFTGPVSVAAEMEFEAVFILGLTEGSYPGGASEDPLITESERSTSGVLPSRAQRRIAERREFLSAVAGSRKVRLSMPRAALRDQRTTLPSRWLLEAASALHGAPVYATELAEQMRNPARPEWFRVAFSFESALAEGEFVSLQERDLASLLASRVRPERHFLSEAIPGLGNGIRARRSRLRRKKVLGDAVRNLDEWNGFVGAGRVPLPSPDHPISPTALETFAACPFRYYLGHVLRVDEVERPEEADVIAAKDVGTIVHDSLEDFFVEMRSRSDPAAAWTSSDRARLAQIANAHCDAAELKGLTGHDLSWVAQKARILRDLDRFLDDDNAFREATGYRFADAELAFGTRPSKPGGKAIPAVQYRVDEETVIAFRGRIDRIDRRPDGSIIVSDYKTGRAGPYKELESADPYQKLSGGKLLQLPVYALAVKEMAAGAPVAAQYWFVSEREQFAHRTVELTSPTEAAFRDVVGRFVRTIREGYFPPVPGIEDRDSWKNCQYCPYDAICPSSHRLELWNQWKEDAGLVEFVELVDGTAGKGADDDFDPAA